MVKYRQVWRHESVSVIRFFLKASGFAAESVSPQLRKNKPNEPVRSNGGVTYCNIAFWTFVCRWHDPAEFLHVCQMHCKMHCTLHTRPTVAAVHIQGTTVIRRPPSKCGKVKSVARSTLESLALLLDQAISCSSLDQQQAMEEWLGGARGQLF